jgi:hypothetical protein
MGSNLVERDLQNPTFEGTETYGVQVMKRILHQGNALNRQRLQEDRYERVVGVASDPHGSNR